MDDAEPDVWLNTRLDGLHAVDAAMRCSICKEFVDVPVALNCGHSFCSLCIRRSLEFRAQCPTCRAPADVNELRPNRGLEAAINAFRAARSVLLALSRSPVPPREDTVRPRRHGSSAANAVVLSDASGGVDDQGYGDEEDDSDYEPDPPSKQPSTRHAAPVRVVADSAAASPAPTAARKRPDGTVTCPVCGASVTEKLINQHLNVCLTRSTAGAPASLAALTPRGGADVEELGAGSSVNAAADTRQNSRSLHPAAGTSSAAIGGHAGQGAAPPQRAGKVCYQIMNETQLRRLLANIPGMNTAGNKAALEARHKEYVLRYNAELDRGAEVSVRSIVDAMNRQERNRQNQGRNLFSMAASSRDASATVSTRARSREIDDSPTKGNVQPSAKPSDFSSLIEQVKRRKMANS